jgi:uncharacterized membrane protein
MKETGEESLERRIEKLEAEVAFLHSRLGFEKKPLVQQPDFQTEKRIHLPQDLIGSQTGSDNLTPLSHPRSGEAEISHGETWLKWSGIALVLFGLAFLFKYSIDRGWLVPAVRVGFGLLVGAGLSILGLRLFATRRHFAQTLTGGGIAALYITGFAAFQLYDLVPHAAAFAFMVAVALFSYFVSSRHSALSMAILGIIGALGTPFLLYDGSGGLPGLVLYTCLVLAAAMLDYYHRGWISLLWVAALGGWAVMLTGVIQGILPGTRWWLEAGVLFCWLSFWIVPVLRAIRNPSEPENQEHSGDNLSAGIMTTLAPFPTLLLSWQTLSLAEHELGWSLMAGAFLYAAVAGSLERCKKLNLASPHMASSVALFTLGLCLLLDGNALLLGLTLEGAVLHFSNRKSESFRLAAAGHALFLIVLVWLIERLIGGHVYSSAVWPLLNAMSMTDLAVLATILAAAWSLKSYERFTCLVLLHILFMFWLLRVLQVLPAGQAWVSLSWGLYALGLLLTGLRLDLSRLRLIAFLTLGALVIKLFMVDLARIEALFRSVLLFLGFGVAFLTLSYCFRSLWIQSIRRSEAKKETNIAPSGRAD